MKTKIPILILSTLFLLQCKDQKADKILISKNEKSKIINSNRFITQEEIRGKNFDDYIDSLYSKNGVIQKHLPIESETFIMGDNDSWLAGIRQGLMEIHTSEEIEKKDIVIKEATWEISDTHFLTVWYERKNQQRIPIQDYVWDKGSDF
jgi:hypothetical protein